MLEKLLFSFLIVFGVFLLATLSAIGLCQLHNQPFINPILTEKQVVERTTEMFHELFAILFVATFVTAMLYENILPTKSHTWFQTIQTIVLYTILIEFFYYIYHRWIHRYYYEIHEKHHFITDPYPFDTFYFTMYDYLGLVVSLGAPLLLLKVTFLEQFLVMYMYTTCSYLSHSNYIHTIHYKHHHLGRCNYCILFPFFDVLLGTYK